MKTQGHGTFSVYGAFVFCRHVKKGFHCVLQRFFVSQVIKTLADGKQMSPSGAEAFISPTVLCPLLINLYLGTHRNEVKVEEYFKSSQVFC